MKLVFGEIQDSLFRISPIPLAYIVKTMIAGGFF